MSPGRRNAAIALALCLATAAVYAPVVDFEFVRFDDPRFVSENPQVRRGLSLEGLRWAFFEPQLNWHPVTYLSHMLDVELFGVEAGAHHRTSALLHGLNVLLLFGWLLWLTGRTWRSAAVAALFALHPLRVESVAWVAERKDLLSAGFGLVALWSYCAWARGAGTRAYLLCAAALLLGLLSKPMLVTLPCVLLLLDFWPLERMGRRAGAGPGSARAGPARLIVEKLPLFALAAASSALTWSFQQGAMRDAAGVPLAARLANAAVAYARYLGKTFWPSDLALLYPHPELPGGTPWAAWQVGAALLLLALLSTGLVLAARRTPRARAALVGWLWFAGMLVPVSGAIAQVGLQAMADRYTYLPSIGLLLGLVWGAAEATRAARRRRPLLAAAAGVAVAAAILACGVAARAQLAYWRDSLALFERALELAPDHPLLHNNLGNALVDRDRLEEAVAHYRRAIALKPDYGVALHNLGNALRSLGRDAEAQEAYRRARDTLPPTPAQWVERGNASVRDGRLDDALDHFSRALALDPDSGPVRVLLAHTHRLRGDLDAAVAAYEGAVELMPRSAVAHQNLGDVLWLLGRRDEAIAHFRRGLELDPESAAARARLENALALPPR